MLRLGNGDKIRVRAFAAVRVVRLRTRKLLGRDVSALVLSHSVFEPCVSCVCLFVSCRSVLALCAVVSSGQ